jgi:hypothetical protein
MKTHLFFGIIAASLLLTNTYPVAAQFRIEAKVKSDELACVQAKVDYEVIFDQGYSGCS